MTNTATVPETVLLTSRLARAYQGLVEAREAFIHGLRSDHALPAWTPEHENDALAAREAAIAVYGDFWFPNPPPEQGSEKRAGPEVVKGYGIVGASPSTVALGHAFNAAKDEFEAALGELRKYKVSAQLRDGTTKVVSMDRAALLSLGLGRLSERQACRRVRILEDRPESIHFVWCCVTSTMATTVDHVRALLADIGTPQAAQAQLALASHPIEEPLGLVQYLNPHMRIDLGYRRPNTPPPLRDPSARPRKRKDTVLEYKLVKSAMPLLLPLAPGESLPRRRAPAAGYSSDTARRRPHTRRRKRLYQDTPLFESTTLAIYRYRADALQADLLRNPAKWDKWRKRLEDYHP